MDNSSGILHPHGLWFIVALFLTGLSLWRATLARRAVSAMFGASASSHSNMKTACSLVCAALLVAAVVRPYFGAEDVKVPTRGADVVFLVDISQSMYARDIPPSRLEVAKRKMKDLVSLLSETGQAARFGIAVFAGDGYTVCPITADRGVLGQFIDIISPDLVSSLGSNLQAGIEAAIGRLDDASKRFTRVIVMSDGEDQFLEAHALVKAISASGVRFDVVGLGTTTGAQLQLPNGAVVVDQQRTPVVSRLHEESLKSIAAAGGGTYVHATLDDSDINTLARASLSLNPGAVTRNDTAIRVYREIGSWLALAALILLVVTAGVRGANPLAVALLLLSSWQGMHTAFAQTPSAQSEATQTTSPYELYTRGDFAKAAEGFAGLLQDTPKDRGLRHGLGSALYKLGEFAESEEVFRKLAEDASEGRHYFESVYNQGNALLSLKRYQDAIDVYRKALDVKPDDERAQHNLQVAQALLEEEKRRAQEPSPTPTPTPTPNPRDKSDSENTPSPSPTPAASPQQSPEASPSPSQTGEPQDAPPSPAPTSQGSPQATATAEGTAPGRDEQQQITPHATASAQASVGAPATSPTPDERLKEALDKDPQETDPTSTVGTTPVPESSAFPEVDAWLQSLPDSPLLIRKQRGRPTQNGQTW
jgi:Ca-activated chloride channel family protein